MLDQPKKILLKSRSKLLFKPILTLTVVFSSGMSVWLAPLSRAVLLDEARLVAQEYLEDIYEALGSKSISECEDDEDWSSFLSDSESCISKESQKYLDENLANFIASDSLKIDTKGLNPANTEEMSAFERIEILFDHLQEFHPELLAPYYRLHGAKLKNYFKKHRISETSNPCAFGIHPEPCRRKERRLSRKKMKKTLRQFIDRLENLGSQIKTILSKESRTPAQAFPSFRMLHAHHAMRILSLEEFHENLGYPRDESHPDLGCPRLDRQDSSSGPTQPPKLYQRKPLPSSLYSVDTETTLESPDLSALRGAESSAL